MLEENNRKLLPFVSVCTPTFNRRPFIEYIIKCFDNQTYPSDRMEWIIIDDGTDLIEDLVINHPKVRYFKYDTKMKLGKKRNLMHEKSIGDILVYMDDDDYYPPTRVQHAVDMLTIHKDALCAGSSEIYIYYKHIQTMYQFGPYHKTHATAGTFAFKRELLKQTQYNEEACIAEEKEFLKNYTVPFVQLDPIQTILVFSHIHNTFDKRKLLEDTYRNPFTKISDKPVELFVKEDDIKEFFMTKIDDLLEDYEPGRAEMKPDVLKEMEAIDVKRKEMIEKRRASAPPHEKEIEQLKRFVELQRVKIIELMNTIKQKDIEIETLKKGIV